MPFCVCVCVWQACVCVCLLERGMCVWGWGGGACVWPWVATSFQPRPAAPSGQPAIPGYTWSTQGQILPAAWTLLTRSLLKEGPVSKERGTEPDYGAGAYWRSDPGLGRADPRLSMQSAWPVGPHCTCAVNRPALSSEGSGAQDPPTLAWILLNIAGAHGLGTSWDMPLLLHYQSASWPTSILITQHS